MKNFRSVILTLLFTLLIYSTGKTQELYQPGHAILKDGTRINGLITFYENDPWFNQRFILIKDSVELAKKPDAKPKKYMADDLKYYQIGTRLFDKVHFVDLENLQLKSFGSNDHMMERLATGRINAHRFYSYPADFEGFSGTESDYREWKKQRKNDLLTGYKILIAKDNESKVKNAFDANLLKYFEDTPEVFQKYQSGGYGNQPVTVKKGLAAKMVAMAKKAAFKPQEAEAMILAFKAYNEKNPSK